MVFEIINYDLMTSGVLHILYTLFGSSALNPEAVFIRFFTVAFFLFLTPAGGL